MTVNTSPVWERTPNVGSGVISVANTNRDGTGTTVQIFAPGADGARVRRITIKATGTTTAGMIRIFTYDATNYRLWKEIPVDAITPSATVETFESITELQGEGAMTLPSGTTLRASTHNAETFHITVEGGNF